MSVQIILEFSGVTAEQYWAVNDALGVDMAAVTGLPDGLIGHVGGTTADGGLVVSEVWESQEKQAAFMESRLGAALGTVGVPEPVKVTWLEVLADVRP